MPLRKSVPTLVKLALRSINESMDVMAIKVMEWARDKPPAILKSVMAEAHQYIWFSVPSVLHDKIFAELSKILSCSFKDYDEESQVAVTARILDMLTPSTLSIYRLKVDWCHDANDVAAALNNLHILKNVKCLDLKDFIQESSPKIENLMMIGLSGMSNLTTIFLGCRYTKIIIQALGENCPNLTTLMCDTFEVDGLINGSMVSSLLKLPHLRKMDIGVWCNKFPLVKLLLGLKNLLEINPYCSRVCDALRLVEDNRSFQQPFKVKSFGDYYIISTKDIPILAKMCPYLTDLNMTLFKATECDPAYLAPLPNLTMLKLHCPGNYLLPVEPILEALGSGLTTLKLNSRIGFDLNTISQFCPNLKNLYLHDTSLHQEWNDKMNLSSFRSLELLDVKGSLNWSIIEPLLLSIINIKVLKIGFSIGEQTMLRIFVQNPMTQLQEFSLSSGHDLSMKTVRTLMANCNNLERIVGLKRWEEIQWFDLRDFREELKMNNIQLDIDSEIEYFSESWVV